VNLSKYQTNNTLENTHSYVFIVRQWNIDFFLSLGNSLKQQNADSSFLYLTMHLDTLDELKSKGIDAIYLPFEFQKHDHKAELFHKIDIDIYSKYGYGVNFLYETERFIPLQYTQKFVVGHAVALYEIIPAHSTLVSLSMEHFVFILAGHINEIKEGENYYIQPVGFPNNASVVLSSPWNIRKFRKTPLEKSLVDDFIFSLSRPPQETIHYMKGDVEFPKDDTILKKLTARYILLKRWMQNKRIISEYQYLDPVEPFPLFLKKTISIWKEKSISMDEIHSLPKETRIFYFPLQYEPEMSILAYSPFYKSQIEIIRLISMSINSNDILLLKENPKMLGNRSSGYYNEIKKYQNVMWADFETNSREIIRHSFKVISITGTATLEAACLGIDSIIFGYPPFNSLISNESISEIPMKNLRVMLNSRQDDKDTIANVYEKWDEYSKAMLIGNFIPRYYGNKVTLNKVDELVNSVIKEVLQIG